MRPCALHQNIHVAQVILFAAGKELGMIVSTLKTDLKIFFTRVKKSAA